MTASTEITGPIIDQSHLQGLLERIAGLGLTLHSVNPLDSRETPGASSRRSRISTTLSRRRQANHQPRRRPIPALRRDREPMTVLWILLAIVYVACWVYFGLATFRKGHYWMFWIGFFLPFLWIIGALIAPTDRAAARAAGVAS